MKNIFKSSLFALMIVALGSCENDKDPVAVAAGGPVLLTPTNETSVVLKPDNPNEVALTMVWDYSNGGVASAPNYSVQAAEAGSDFANPIVLGVTSSRFLSLTSSELNALLTPDRFIPYVPSDLEIRVVSNLGTASNAMMQMSNVVSIKVTPFSNELPKLGVPGAHQGWNPEADDLPILRSSAYGATDYEGYVFLDGEYKFLEPKPDGTFAFSAAPDYGDNGDFAGILLAGGSNLSAAQGYYLLKANTGLLTYSQTPMSWGIIGSATPTGWDSDTDLTYDPATKTLSTVMVLSGGNEIKFRANNGWDTNFGDDGVDGQLEQGGANIMVANSGTYLITLDLSHPRDYRYTLTPQ